MDDNSDNKDQPQPTNNGAVSDSQASQLNGFDQEPSTMQPDGSGISADESAGDDTVGDTSSFAPTQNFAKPPVATSSSAPMVDIVNRPEASSQNSVKPAGQLVESALDLESRQTASSSLMQSSGDEEAVADQLASKAFASQKKSKKGLIITIISLLILVGGVVGGYFFVKFNADTVANNYINSANSYVDSVTGLALEPIVNPAATKDQISSIDRPVLGEVFMSNLSTRYSEAATMQVDISSRIGQIALKLEEMQGYLSLQEFVAEYSKDATAANSILSDVPANASDENKKAAYASYITSLGSLKTKVDEAVLNVDLDDEKTKLSDSIQAEIVLYEAMVAATGEKPEQTALDQAKTTRDADFAVISSANEESEQVLDLAEGDVKAAALELGALKRA